jgi:hypothetical protein
MFSEINGWVVYREKKIADKCQVFKENLIIAKYLYEVFNTILGSSAVQKQTQDTHSETMQDHENIWL